MDILSPEEQLHAIEVLEEFRKREAESEGGGAAQTQAQLVNWRCIAFR